MAIKILTDSSSDLSKDMIKDYNIEVIPLLVYVDDVEFQDEINITSSEIAQKMLDGKTVKTTQVPMHTFHEHFMNLDEKDTLICVPISSGISGTYQTAIKTAQMVKEERPNLDIRILDAKIISLALGIVLMEAGKMINEGASADEVVDYILTRGKYMKHLFTVPELEWLLKGGRVSRTSAKLGTLLDIKPILHVENGGLVPIDKVRGKKQRFNKMKEYILNNSKSLEGQTVGIAHVLNQEEAEKMADFLNENLKPDKIIIKNLGAVIASHTGPGLLSIYFKSDEEKAVLK